MTGYFYAVFTSIAVWCSEDGEEYFVDDGSFLCRDGAEDDRVSGGIENVLAEDAVGYGDSICTRDTYYADGSA